MYNNQPYYGMQQPFPQMQQTPYIPSQPHQNALVSVNGVDGAKAYQMPPNSKAALFDANEDIFYLKESDGAGFCTITPYRFVKVEPEKAPPAQDYVTRAEFEKVLSELKEMMTHAE